MLQSGRERTPARSLAADEGTDVLIERRHNASYCQGEGVRQDHPSDDDEDRFGGHDARPSPRAFFADVVFGIADLPRLHVFWADPREVTRPVISASLRWRSSRQPAPHIPQPHGLPAGGDGAEAGDVVPGGVVAGEATREKLVEEGVAEAFGGGDDLLGALDGLVDGVEDGGDGALLGEGKVGNGQLFGEKPGRDSLATADVPSIRATACRRIGSEATTW